MKKSLTVEDVIAALKQKQGNRTNVDFANELGVTKAYLGDLYMGRRTPGPTILEHLGMVKEITYRRVA